MTKILLIGAPITGNFGGPSILLTVKKILDEYFPDSEYTFLSSAKNDKIYEKEYGMKIINYSCKPKKAILNIVGAFLKRRKIDISKIRNPILEEFYSADIIIDIWGIIFADSLSSQPINHFFNASHLLIGKIFRKPVIKYTADIGPFNKRLTKIIAKFYLKRLDLIIVRNEETRKNLLGIGIKTAIQECPDTAFLLEGNKNKKIIETLVKELVGLSVSHVASKKGKDRDYISKIANLADYIIEKYDSEIVLIPNEIFDNIYDDLDVAKDIMSLIKNKKAIHLVEKELNAKDLKATIGQCDLFVGCRYHSVVASLSMGIPTITIGWHHKYNEIMSLVNQEKYVIDIEKLEIEDIQKSFNDLRDNKTEIKKEIASKIPSIKEKISKGGKRTKDIFENLKIKPN